MPDFIREYLKLAFNIGYFLALNYRAHIPSLSEREIERGGGEIDRNKHTQTHNSTSANTYRGQNRE